MASATGLQVLGCVDGGSANKGQDVHMKLHVTDGKKPFDLSLFVQHDLLAIILSHILTFGGMARNTRMQRNPTEETDGTYASGHALLLANVFAGRSVTAPDHALITLQFDAGAGRKLNLYAAAQQDALLRLRAACDSALAMLTTDPILPPKH